MEDLRKVRVVDMRKNAEELSINMFYCPWEGRREGTARFSGKHIFIVEEVLYPCHHIIYVCWCRKKDVLVLVRIPYVI